MLSRSLIPTLRLSIVRPTACYSTGPSSSNDLLQQLSKIVNTPAKKESESKGNKTAQSANKNFNDRKPSGNRSFNAGSQSNSNQSDKRRRFERKRGERQATITRKNSRASRYNRGLENQFGLENEHSESSKYIDYGKTLDEYYKMPMEKFNKLSRGELARFDELSDKEAESIPTPYLPEIENKIAQMENTVSEQQEALSQMDRNELFKLNQECEPSDYPEQLSLHARFARSLNRIGAVEMENSSKLNNWESVEAANYDKYINGSKNENEFFATTNQELKDLVEPIRGFAALTSKRV